LADGPYLLVELRARRPELADFFEAVVEDVGQRGHIAESLTQHPQLFFEGARLLTLPPARAARRAPALFTKIEASVLALGTDAERRERQRASARPATRLERRRSRSCLTAAVGSPKGHH
jgi:hypothetical protein